MLKTMDNEHIVLFDTSVLKLESEMILLSVIDSRSNLPIRPFPRDKGESKVRNCLVHIRDAPLR